MSLPIPEEPILPLIVSISSSIASTLTAKPEAGSKTAVSILSSRAFTPVVGVFKSFSRVSVLVVSVSSSSIIFREPMPMELEIFSISS